MPLHAEDQTLNLESDERVSTELIGLRYTGRKSVMPPAKPRNQGGWPGRTVFQGGPAKERDEEGRVVEREPGPIQIGINPDWMDDETVSGGALRGLENLADFEVVYDTETLAEAMLGENYLPVEVFGSPPSVGDDNERPPDYGIRNRVFERFGLEDVGHGPGSHQQYREQLAEIAGVDWKRDDADRDPDRERELTENHSRRGLLAAALHLGYDVDDTTPKSELADRLADEEPAKTRAVFEVVGPADADDLLTADDGGEDT